MSVELGLGAIAGLCALWIAYRMRGNERELLPPPDPHCQRPSVESVPS